MIEIENIIEFIYKLRKYFFPSIFNEESNKLLQDFKNENLESSKEIIFREIKKVDKIEREEIDSIFEEIKSIEEVLNCDIEKFLESDPAVTSKEEVILTYPGLFAIFIYRISHILYLHKITLIPRMMTEYAHQLTGIDIHPGAKIGKRFFIDHGTGIVIGETSIIGEDVKIYQGVTIGALSLDKGKMLKNVKRHPTILNNVTIYANATILGADTIIGNNVIIGGNTFITSSVKDNMIVYLKKQDLVSKENRRDL